MSGYERIAGLDVEIEDYTIEPRQLDVSGFVRATTTIVLRGGGGEGRGEDVTYETDAHDGYPKGLPVAGRFTLEGFATLLDGLEDANVGYRRWAFESAVLDLAL